MAPFSRNRVKWTPSGIAAAILCCGFIPLFGRYCSHLSPVSSIHYLSCKAWLLATTDEERQQEALIQEEDAPSLGVSPDPLTEASSLSRQPPATLPVDERAKARRGSNGSKVVDEREQSRKDHYEALNHALSRLNGIANQSKPGGVYWDEIEHIYGANSRFIPKRVLCLNQGLSCSTLSSWNP
ncbi:hypothetical protein FI667_g13893, partial [Globisporangium splendens]